MVVGYVFGWLSEDTSGGSLTSANNGLSVSGTVVQMGGPLIQNTSIDLATFNLLYGTTSGGKIGIGVTGTPATSFEVAGNDANAIMVSARYQTSAIAPAGFVARKANGTQASPSQVLSADHIGGLGAAGYTSSGAFGTTSGQAIFTAAENFTSSARGTNFIVQLAPIGSTTLSTFFQIGQDGIVQTSRYLKYLTDNNNFIDFGASNGIEVNSLTLAALRSATQVDVITASDHFITLINSGRQINTRGDAFDFYQSANGMGSAFKVTNENSSNDTIAYLYSSLGVTSIGIGITAPTASLHLIGGKGALQKIQQSTVGNGTVQTAGTTALVGTGTTFLSTFNVGDTITVSGETVRTISAITDDTNLTVTVAFSTTSGGLSYTLTGGVRVTFLGNGGAKFDGRVLENKGANVTAANDLTLGGDGNAFTITGNTQINAITTSGWRAAAQVVLVFTGTPTVKNNTAGGAGTALLLLAGSVDLVAAANTVLGLIYDGTQWQETFRKVA